MKIEPNNFFVKIKYTVRAREDGPILKGGGSQEILDFVTGFRQVVPGLETRLIGREVGERMTFVVPPDEAFGPRFDQLVIEKKREDFHFPPGWEPAVGMELPLITSVDEAPDTAIIKEIRSDTIVIDVNHPLAGMPLKYDLEIIEARPARPNEVCGEWEAEHGESGCSGCGTQPGDSSCSSCAPQSIVLGDEGPGGRDN